MQPVNASEKARPMPRCPDPKDPKQLRELVDSIKRHPVPELGYYADPLIPWCWWRGLLYVAGFARKEAALEYGLRHGWISGESGEKS